MKIHILSIGKIKADYTLDWERELTKRLSPYAKINFIQLKEEPITKNKNITKIKKLEGKKILQNIPKRSFMILLDKDGTSLTSINFASKIQSLQNITNELTFIIGGPLGVSDKIKEKANYTLSFSKFTFTHQLMRILLLEQVYRAFAILNNKPYHK